MLIVHLSYQLYNFVFQYETSKTEMTSDVISGSRTSESQKREQTRSRSKSGATKEDTKEEFVVRKWIRTDVWNE